MLDLLLNIGRAFDWLSPTTALIEDIYYGHESDFVIPTAAGWSMSEIKCFLNQHGIKVWGLIYSLDGDELMFSVKKEQSEYVYYLLQNAGDPEYYLSEEAQNNYYLRY